MSNDVDSFARLFFIVASLSLCVSCARQSSSKIKPNAVALLQHAKQNDVPIPVGFTPVATQQEIYDQKNQVALCYNGNLTVEQSVAFYKKTMEFNGWEIEDFSQTPEGLLFCSKANKQCAISIRPMKKKGKEPKTGIRFTMQNKQYCTSHHHTKNSPDEEPITTKYLDTDYQDIINRKKITLS